MNKQITTSIVFAIAIAAPAAAQDAAVAQTPPPQQAAPFKPINMDEMRRHIYVMEGALAQAVDFGAKQLNRQILSVMPGVFMLEGEARARGVHLDGYGVFFDVRVPMMRQSMVWSLRMMMDQGDAANQQLVADLRKQLQGITDPNTRASMERAIRQLERSAPGALARNQQVTPGLVMPEPSSPAVGAATAAGISNPRPAPAPSPADSVWVQDPNRAYTEAVTRALVDAMIDYSTPMSIGPDQWLTVAARDDEGRNALTPQDPLEEVVTMIYRIKGSDLLAYRSGRIDRDEVRKRVQMSQF
jgi:hypothetical protein